MLARLLLLRHRARLVMLDEPVGHPLHFRFALLHFVPSPRDTHRSVSVVPRHVAVTSLSRLRYMQAAGMEEQASLRLHAVINERLSHASLIAITHRVLPLVHLFSRVIAFEQGVCIEDAPPSELLQQPHSQLHFLFEQVAFLYICVLRHTARCVTFPSRWAS